ncbi:SRPBCC domain-containing protein [Actinomadura sp. HBU206391]|uniref:SRPBCC family protein n=1 Tax=Actinomadura sp. HBU206391 TaxID=2731692 RepID=UPI00164F5BCC|nr:SRPBCC domain-containing protein [Actinomadura sp. HBU206391]MBC6456805.1 SRPBCC domain-containing protein [Actinomadura sp. HBU206391]
MSGVVQVKRILKASPEEVFDAWTDADRLQQWLCPDPGIVAEASCDPVVGGRYRIVKIFESGADEVTGEYLVVEPSRRLVFTWSAGSTDDQTTQVTVTLRPDDDTTEMTIIHERLPNLGVQGGARSAWASIAGRLDGHLAATAERP